MKYAAIRAYRGELGVGERCRLLRVSRSGYYAWCRRSPSRRRRENELLVQEIKAIHERSRRCYGSPRIHAELLGMGIECGRNRIARLMRLHGIRARHRRKYRYTTDSKHDYPVAPNLLNRCFAVSRPDKVWVSDITYIATAEGWLYVATVMDLYARRIVGWSMGERVTRGLTMAAMQMALIRREPGPGLIHHSDRGSQYACDDYRELLRRNGIRCSMSRKGDCYDNAAKESFYSSMKREWVFGRNYQTRREARADLFEYIEIFYNRQRRHSTLGYLSPAEFEERRNAA